MGQEIDLLANYPKTKRDVKERGAKKTEEDRAIARQFGKDFFDGDRKHGYGGFYYLPRFWQSVIPTFQRHWNLTNQSSILDIGCAKGFMMHDFKELMPEIKIAGVDVSEYAIEHAIEPMKPYVQVADAKSLPFEDDSFDLIISINTIHNLPLDDCKQSLREIQRVSKAHSFLTVDAWRNEEQHIQFLKWNLTALTYMHVDEWNEVFVETGYTGDYYWFIAE